MIGVPKDPEYRNRALLDLAHRHDAFCGNCHKQGPSEPAHSNYGEHGKGARRKAHDVFFAMMCHECHVWYDQGGRGRDPTGVYEATYEDKRLMWFGAFAETLLWMWRNELVMVVKRA